MASVLLPSSVQHYNRNNSETDRSSSSIDITKAVVEIETVNRIPNRGSRTTSGAAVETAVEGGVCLTWEDLWVTVSSRAGKNRNRPILQGLTGYARPGELLAIMGPSGSGKSTLLDALAGRLSSKTRQSGEILINGHKQTLAYGTSAYVTQDDTLMTTLTVGEAVHYSAQLQLPDSMPLSEKKERANGTIKEMGLQDAINTRIGGWGAKGISGGQKRRVSICIEILTRPKLLFLDEPTSGLDSAASYYVMSRIAGLDQSDGVRRTIVASIHQPSSEVFQLFDSLCLLSAGKTVYFGPASEANEFFASSGFPCPTLQNPSDHFLKTINKDFEQDIESGMVGVTCTVEEAIDTLMKSYKASEGYKQVRRHVADISNKQDYRAVEIKIRSHASFLNQCLVLTRRSFKNMHRDWGYYWLRIVIYVSLSLGLGTLYYEIGSDYESIQSRGSLLMFVASFLTFMTIGGFPSFVEDMKVFERERLNGHYSATAFVIGNTLSSQPYLLLISLIPGALTYYLPGLRKDYQHFSYFILVLYVCMMLVESLMMIVASLVPNFLMGIIAGSGIQCFMILGGGFFRLPGDLPKQFWRYPLFYVAFHRYAYQGLFKNEFEGLVFPNNELGGGATITGEEILKSKWQVNMSYSKWVDLAVLLGMVVFYRVLFLAIVKTAERVKSFNMSFPTIRRNHSIQIVENPIATPLHAEK
ncbi:ABC transporter G family member 11 [Morus notabilis]|uniref:ABC transporter G family member 11 n=1 Tax=Morus notabilis TaxID=981085 RepID=W9RHU7_9ROSA|nr:ABC transporter G family member 11 isoform X2 [Morus notabilis]EXB55275.1 ABC transporter G family member 11 [Morus notabilis]